MTEVVIFFDVVFFAAGVFVGGWGWPWLRRKMGGY